jgi:iron complex outermembrane receptor protein
MKKPHLDALGPSATVLGVFAYCLAAPAFAAEAEPAEAVELEAIEVAAEKPTVKVGPFEGLELEKEQIPGNLQSLTSEDIKQSRATSLGGLMNSKLQSVNVNDYQGNPFQMDVSYRGFSASPQLGTPQGLSVFLDGVRVNESFGDVVNWDLIPLNALAGMDMFPGSNPLFGLNTLGGALALRTKSGFTDPGLDVSFQGGSWGRKHGQLSVGGNNGALGGFLAFNGFAEDGWRDNSPSEVLQGFGRADWRGENFSVKATMLLIGNQLLGNGLVPTGLYEQRPSAVFSSPDQTNNNLQQYLLGGEYHVNPQFNITGQIYLRNSRRKNQAGDIYEDFREMENGWSNPQLAKGTSNGNPVCQYQDLNHDGVPDYAFDNDQDGVADPGTVNAPLTPKNRDNVTLVPALNGGDCGRVNYEPVSIDSGPRNGARGDPSNRKAGLSSRGWVDGTPIGVVNNTGIQQYGDGAALQLNWNLEQHKFMLGGAIDATSSDFESGQQLALMNGAHRVYTDPANLDPVFVAGRQEIHNNTFSGQSINYSGYFSETFSPWENVHLSFAGRFNHTQVKNRLKSRTRAGYDNLHDIMDLNRYRPTVIVCPSADPASCPSQPNYNLRANWDRDVVLSQDPYYGLGQYSERPSTEQFTYDSFNPSVGISVLPVEDLNLFFNWSQGTRTPSNIELGCAYDRTMVAQDPNDPDSPMVPRSFASIGGACTLPTTLSGDPFLPQIFARTYEFGLRGKFLEDWEWNAGVYRTDLSDDIYLVGITATRSFFDTIGDTRRQGVEFGLSGKLGIADIRVSYGYTDASFQSTLFMLSPYNSSAQVATPLQVAYDKDGRPTAALQDMIRVDPGDRIPGIPLHNVNVSLDLHLTQRWDFGINMIAHSSSYVRGNENNDHEPGTYEYVRRSVGTGYAYLPSRPFTNKGTTPGYVIFNLKTSYEIVEGLSVFGLVNNLFDQTYYTAGRLGINPFSPAAQGTVGSSGWNYNSNDWLNTTMVAPGAPRGFWAGIEYRY